MLIDIHLRRELSLNLLENLKKCFYRIFDQTCERYNNENLWSNIYYIVLNIRNMTNINMNISLDLNGVIHLAQPTAEFLILHTLKKNLSVAKNCI